MRYGSLPSRVLISLISRRFQNVHCPCNKALTRGFDICSFSISSGLSNLLECRIFLRCSRSMCGLLHCRKLVALCVHFTFVDVCFCDALLVACFDIGILLALACRWSICCGSHLRRVFVQSQQPNSAREVDRSATKFEEYMGSK